MPGDDDKYMTLSEAAEYLDLSTRTVQRQMAKWAQTGGREGIEFERYTDNEGSHRRVLRRAVKDFAVRRRRPT